MLPYIEQDDLYSEFKLDEPWDCAAQQEAHREDAEDLRAGQQAGQAGVHAPANGHRPERDASPVGTRMPASFPDGTSNTIAVVEAAEPVIWTKPDDVMLPGKELPKDLKKKFGGLYPGGFNVLMWDGSVRFVKDSVSESTLQPGRSTRATARVLGPTGNWFALPHKPHTIARDGVFSCPTPLHSTPSTAPWTCCSTSSGSTRWTFSTSRSPRSLDQFLEHLQGLRELDVEFAGEFLVMAATLMEIKSRMILPADAHVGEEGESDPRRELVKQLLEYRKIKDAAAALEERAEARGTRVARQEPPEPAQPGAVPRVRTVESVGPGQRLRAAHARNAVARTGDDSGG